MARSMADIYNQVDVPGDSPTDDNTTPDSNADGGPGPDAPAGYKPLTNGQRTDWNNFVRYLNRDKKVGGSADLDAKDKGLGQKYLQEYKDAHPDFSITPDMVSHVQYEIANLKQNKSLPEMAPLNPQVNQLVNDYYSNRDVSPVDGWIGSLTSRQAYPEIQAFTDDPNKKYWGVDYNGASDFASKNWKKK